MNTNELNKVLSDEIYKLRAGKVKPERVNAVTRAASQIIASARLELAFIKMMGGQPVALPFFGQHGRPALVPKKGDVRRIGGRTLAARGGLAKAA